ncbi:ribosomal protein S18 acetylase RimI-like enzyme [Dongia mobilis]|uniref:Ribosomal protein S18 acetylase RimI-like enzyme n=2 Tax=Dongia mobilis TaxID=578943 RepID=A0A4R6WSY6_9PROT|nr:ribosomal protein S18 acetylase RimI-like enzyme [Dongia mobilis]
MNAEAGADIAIEIVSELKRGELEELCEATEAAIAAGGGFGWLKPPHRNILEVFWKGVTLVPDRALFVAKLDGIIAGSAQLVRPTRNNEAQAHSAQLTTSFVAPWARGHGLARQLTLAVEREARTRGARVLNLDVRETQGAAIQLYRSLGFHEIGRHPRYAMVDGQFVAGLYFWKSLVEGES